MHFGNVGQRCKCSAALNKLVKCINDCKDQIIIPCKIENGATSDNPYRQEITAVEFVQYRVNSQKFSNGVQRATPS